MESVAVKKLPTGDKWTYDAAGHLASMASTHTNFVSTSYTYDSLNRLSTVVDGRLTGNQTTTYGLRGKICEIVKSSYSDSNLRLLKG